MRRFLPALALLFSAIVGACAEEKIVFSDNFEEAKTGDGGANVASATKWRTKGAKPTLTIEADASGINQGNALLLHSNMVLTEFPAVSLEDGQSLRLTFTYRYTSAPNPAANVFRVGLYNSTTGDAEDGKAQGYWVMATPGSNEGRAMIFYEAGEDGLGGGNDLTLLGDVFSGHDCGTIPNKFSLTLTKSGGGMEVSYKLNDDEAIIRTQETARVSTFNALAIASGVTSSNALVIDNVILTAAKPGP